METTIKSFPISMLHRHYRHSRRMVVSDIKYLESQFKATSKINDPEAWLTLQGKLGIAYSALMQLEKNTKPGAIYRVRQSAI
jgi:hypothetical protein